MSQVRRDLLLVRHAKSAWDDPSLNDHDRPLAPRGTKATRRMSDYLAQAEYRPDVVLCSSSRRTMDTLDGIRAALPRRARVELADELYLADANTLLKRLHGLNGKDRCAMLVGHNLGSRISPRSWSVRATPGCEHGSRSSSPLAPSWRSRSSARGQTSTPVLPESMISSLAVRRGRDGVRIPRNNHERVRRVDRCTCRSRRYTCRRAHRTSRDRLRQLVERRSVEELTQTPDLTDLPIRVAPELGTVIAARPSSGRSESDHPR